MSAENPRAAGRGGNQPPLPRLIQDYLGRKLRSELYETGERPQYLGDPAIPPEFEPLIEQIVRKDRSRASNLAEDAGYQAVADALKDFDESGRS